MKYFDVHHHAIPPFYAEALRRAGLDIIDGFPIPEWTVQLSIDFMDRASIAFAVLALTIPGVDFLEGAEARTMAMRCNDFMAEVARQHPDRLGFFAVLPLDDIGEAVDEARRAIDELGALGIGLYTNHHGVYPGNERFWPLYEQLNARGTTVFFHPVRPANLPAVDLRPPILFYPVDTTYAAADMVVTGTLNKFPSIQWILPHTGGAVPFLRQRIIIGGANVGQDPEKMKLYAEAMQGLRFDTAGAFDPECLQMAAKASEQPLLYGSDFPFMTEPVILRTQKVLETTDLPLGTIAREV